MLKRLISLLQSVIIVSLLALVLFLFIFDRSHTLASFVWKFVIITLVTDFLYLSLHLFRRETKHSNLSFDRTKLTVVIACYNGEDIITETINNALVHVKAQQIIVVSDASTDRTARTALNSGVRVYENVRNLNKAFTISSIMRHVHTEYVLILDDDTLIGKTFIPTSLLDEGYSAVSFNVMPLPESTLINKLQTFEYRKSMFLGKSRRAGTGTVGNISGAIGLYRTADLRYQARRHSGQFGGEDEQRTSLLHLHSRDKGVTFTDSLVETKAPATLKALFRQRAFRWNLSLPELFSVYWRIIFGSRQHYMLKTEKAYQIFLYTTDPLRILLIWISFFYPWRLVILYVFYLFLTIATWLKLEHKDPFWLVFIFPFYRSAEIVCRIIAHFYWFIIKYKYIFKEKFHRFVTLRRVVPEYAFVAILICLIWGVSIIQLKAKADILRSNLSAPAEPEAVEIDKKSVSDLIKEYGPTASPDALVGPKNSSLVQADKVIGPVQ